MVHTKNPDFVQIAMRNPEDFGFMPGEIVETTLKRVIYPDRNGYQISVRSPLLNRSIGLAPSEYRLLSCLKSAVAIYNAALSEVKDLDEIYSGGGGAHEYAR